LLASVIVKGSPVMPAKQSVPFRAELLVQGQTRMLFAGNMVRQPLFDSMRPSGEDYRVVGDLANTDRIMRDAFWIGVYPGLTHAMLERMAEVIASAVA
jgi:CDP-6-deoxy-D-xylo-4-hexulose-3-dehydrase